MNKPPTIQSGAGAPVRTRPPGRVLSRRTILRGLGAAISLPLLDAMVPVSPLRLAFIYVPNGILMNHWTPASEGTGFEFPRILAPLAPHRDKVLVLSGLTQNTGRALGDAAGDHARASATYLTGVHPKKTDGAGICAGVSVDQVAASHVGAASQNCPRSNSPAKTVDWSATAIPAIAAHTTTPCPGALPPPLCRPK